MKEVERYTVLVGDDVNKKSNVATFIVILIPEKQRELTNARIKVNLRERLMKDYAWAKPSIVEYAITGDPYIFVVNIYGDSLAEMEAYSKTVLEKLIEHRDLTDIKLDMRAASRIPGGAQQGYDGPAGDHPAWGPGAVDPYRRGEDGKLSRAERVR
jgi:multidrug efflux pump subunit AcrB